MGIDISSGVGYGYMGKISEKGRENLAAYAKQLNPKSKASADDIWSLVDELYGKFDGIAIERSYDENRGEEYFSVFVKEIDIYAGEKYESVTPIKLDANPTFDDTARASLQLVTGLLELDENEIGWYFYKIVW